MEPSQPQSSGMSISKTRLVFNQQVQRLLDKSTPHIAARWAALALVLVAYIVRVNLIRGFYIISYGLAIYNLNLLLGFITPQIDPDMEGPKLPTKEGEEFRPFARRLPEFKFWLNSLKSFLTGFTLTFFPVFDVPVFWPILLLYWFVLFVLTMKRQIRHMIKHKYVPISFGKRVLMNAASLSTPLPAIRWVRANLFF